MQIRIIHQAFTSFCRPLWIYCYKVFDFSPVLSLSMFQNSCNPTRCDWTTSFLSELQPAKSVCWYITQNTNNELEASIAPSWQSNKLFMSKQSQTPATCYKQLYQLRSTITDLNETRIVTSNLKKRLQIPYWSDLPNIYLFCKKMGTIY